MAPSFVDGRGYAGRVDEITLPKLTIKTEKHRAGGMDVPVEIVIAHASVESRASYPSTFTKTRAGSSSEISCADRYRWPNPGP